MFGEVPEPLKGCRSQFWLPQQVAGESTTSSLGDSAGDDTSFTKISTMSEMVGNPG
jgi:hypothetical protein